MNKHMKKSILTIILFLTIKLNATPSTIIWIPSTDIQSFNTYHFGIDNYFTIFKKGIGEGGSAFPTNLGLTVGISPLSNLGVEIGVDIFEPQKSPWVFNGKIGVPEGLFMKWLPSFALGGCYFGTEKEATDINMIYVIAAKTMPVIGRLSAGYYKGNSKLLKTPEGKTDDQGMLLSLDKQLKEVDERLWIAVDYQSGKNSLGAYSVGFAWSFSESVSVLVGRVMFNNGAPSMLTTQLDINL